MFCTNCGKEFKGEVIFCDDCGAYLGGEPKAKVVAPEQPYENTVAEKKESIFNKLVGRKKKTVKKRELSNDEIEKFSGVFAGKDETYVASLGNGYIANYLKGKGIKKGFAILSNKRVYFKGSCLNKNGRFFTNSNEERTVDVKDITGSGFISKNNPGILFNVILYFLLVIGCFWYENTHFVEEVVEEALGFYKWIFGIGAVFFLILYQYKKWTLFSIEYAGGCIAFTAAFYAREELEEFQKQLRQVKDEMEEAAYRKEEVQVQPAPSNDIPEELRKYADLLKDGLISQEEYDTMKKKLLGM